MLQPFQTPEVLVVVEPGSAFARVDFLTVPADKQLIIEYVSGQALVPLDQYPAISVVTIVNSDLGLHHTTPFKLGSNNNVDVFFFSQLMRVYADPGTTASAQLDLPTAYVENPAAGSPPALLIWISGQLVDLAGGGTSSYESSSLRIPWAHGHFWGWMSLARVKPFAQLACRDVAIFTSLIIDELIPKSGHEPLSC